MKVYAEADSLTKEDEMDNGIWAPHCCKAEAEQLLPGIKCLRPTLGSSLVRVRGQ